MVYVAIRKESINGRYEVISMELRLISFNVRCCDDPDGNSIAERAPRLKKVVEPIDADVIALQEIRPQWVPEIEAMFSDRYEAFLCYRSIEKPEGLITLWKKERFLCLDKGYFWFSETPERESFGWDEKYHRPRICSYVVLQEKGSATSFLLMNTHFGFGDDGQVKSARLIHKYRNNFPHLKAIVTGDFNMTNTSLGYQAMIENFVDVNAVTVNDRRATYHAYAPSPEQKSHIDFFFCDENVRPFDFRLIDETVDGKYPSDHFGICTTLLL